MSRQEIKQWSKEKIKGHIWELLVPIIVAGILTGLSIGGGYDTDTGKYSAGVNLGFFFYFVQVGLVYFMVKFVNGQDHEFKDLFHFVNDYVRIFLVNLLQVIFIVLWCLLLIVPGIIKSFAYALVPYILADDKYKDLGYRDVLKKSEEMMSGHKMDYFMFGLSFIGWFLLVLPTLGLICIWLSPYFETAKTKFLNGIKEDFEGTSEKKVEKTDSKEETAKKECPNCKTKNDASVEFCTNCGQKFE